MMGIVSIIHLCKLISYINHEGNIDYKEKHMIIKIEMTDVSPLFFVVILS